MFQLRSKKKNDPHEVGWVGPSEKERFLSEWRVRGRDSGQINQVDYGLYETCERADTTLGNTS